VRFHAREAENRNTALATAMSLLRIPLPYGAVRRYPLGRSPGVLVASLLKPGNRPAEGVMSGSRSWARARGRSGAGRSAREAALSFHLPVNASHDPSSGCAYRGHVLSREAGDLGVGGSSGTEPVSAASASRRVAGSGWRNSAYVTGTGRSSWADGVRLSGSRRSRSTSGPGGLPELVIGDRHLHRPCLQF